MTKSRQLNLNGVSTLRFSGDFKRRGSPVTHSRPPTKTSKDAVSLQTLVQTNFSRFSIVTLFFYRYSIVGFERAAGAAGLEIHFRYLDETIRFNPKSNSFMVHRGLKEALELRDAGDAIEHIE